VVRIYHKPFVDWIWGGAFLMALGGVLAITDRRYRLASKAEREVSATASVVIA
jgi:cytochrome c-type biogenesis protein CcmF